MINMHCIPLNGCMFFFAKRLQRVCAGCAIDGFRNWSNILTNLWLTLQRSSLIKLHTTSQSSMHGLFIQLVGFCFFDQRNSFEWKHKMDTCYLTSNQIKSKHVHQKFFGRVHLILWILIENNNTISMDIISAPAYSMRLFLEMPVEFSNRLKMS